MLPTLLQGHARYESFFWGDDDDHLNLDFRQDSPPQPELGSFKVKVHEQCEFRSKIPPHSDSKCFVVGPRECDQIFTKTRSIIRTLSMVEGGFIPLACH